MHALDGRFIAPAPGGDLLRTPDILPTGRNLHGFDPFRIPSAFAVRDGARQADTLLARHSKDGHALPETIAMVLWGTDNLKTEGGPIAQVLWLMGAEPRHDSYGRLAGAKLIPLETLGRPRIDVMVTLSGIFRDLLPLQTKLIAEAALLAAAGRRAGRDELHPQACARLPGRAWLRHRAGRAARLRQCRRRLWRERQSAVDSGGWNDEDELAEAFVRRKGFAYGVDGRASRQEAVLSPRAGSMSMSPTRTSNSIELGVTTVDHYFDTLGGISRAVRRARGTRGQMSISATRRAARARCAPWPSRSRSRPAPARSIRNGTRRC